MEVTREEIQALRKSIYDLTTKTDSILSILQGQELDENDHGMIGKTNDMGKRLSRLERFKDRATWLIIGMSIPAGYGITEVLSWVLTKK
jgi:hypothetical protein